MSGVVGGVRYAPAGWVLTTMGMLILAAMLSEARMMGWGSYLIGCDGGEGIC